MSTATKVTLTSNPVKTSLQVIRGRCAIIAAESNRDIYSALSQVDILSYEINRLKKELKKLKAIDNPSKG